MRRLVWVLGWIAVALWSLVAWGSYGLLDVFGNLAARNADLFTGHPETVEWLSWGFNSLRGLGLAAIVAVWGLVSLMILAATAVMATIVGAASRGEHPRGDFTYRAPPRRPPSLQDRGLPSAVRELLRRIEKR